MLWAIQSCAKVRSLLVLIGSLLLAGFASHAAPPPGYVLHWSDEFGGSALDTNKWNHRLPGPRNDAINTEDAVSVTNGTLTITTYTEGGTNFTGMIGSEDLYMPRYGYIEARINFNDSPGEWSAFWMTAATMVIPGDPHTNGTEIDIVEHRSVNQNNVLNHNRAVANIHWDGYGTQHKTVGSGLVGANLSSGWHLFAMEWTPTAQRFYYDEILVWGVTNSTAEDPIPPEVPVSQRSQYLILSSEVRDNNWAGTIPVGGYGNRSNSTTKMNVDYVRSFTFSPTAPVLSATNLGGPQIGMSFYGSTGVAYVLQQSMNLLTWTNIATNVAPAGGLITYTNPANANAGYYRARTKD